MRTSATAPKPRSRVSIRQSHSRPLGDRGAVVCTDDPVTVTDGRFPGVACGRLSFVTFTPGLCLQPWACAGPRGPARKPADRHLLQKVNARCTVQTRTYKGAAASSPERSG